MPDARDSKTQGEGARWVLILLVPLAALLVLAGWILGTGTLGELQQSHQGNAREERALLAIDATPQGDVALLVAALEREPAAWDTDTVRAVAALLARSDWPPAAPPGSGRLLADRAPSTWDEEQRAVARELLEVLRRMRAPMDASRDPGW